MKTTVLTSLCFVTFLLTITDADQIVKTPETVTKSTASSEHAVANQLLASAKALQAKQDYTTELKAITDAKKTVEAARLKAVVEFTKQQAALVDKKADKAAQTALEAQRKAMSERFNELIRLIDQVDKNLEPSK